MLRTSRAMQERLRARLEIAQIAIEEQSPHGLADRRAARFSGQNDGPASGTNAFRKFPRLRRLARTVDTFECDELAAPHLERTVAVELDAAIRFFALAPRPDVVAIGQLVLQSAHVLRLRRQHDAVHAADHRPNRILGFFECGGDTAAGRPARRCTVRSRRGCAGAGTGRRCKRNDHLLWFDRQRAAAR